MSLLQPRSMRRALLNLVATSLLGRCVFRAHDVIPQYARLGANGMGRTVIIGRRLGRRSVGVLRRLHALYHVILSAFCQRNWPVSECRIAESRDKRNEIMRLAAREVGMQRWKQSDATTTFSIETESQGILTQATSQGQNRVRTVQARGLDA